MQSSKSYFLPCEPNTTILASITFIVTPYHEMNTALTSFITLQLHDVLCETIFLD